MVFRGGVVETICVNVKCRRNGALAEIDAVAVVLCAS